mmetsp:Transcript_5534/g.34250  ORF Transcript_5534/g.34250 Transcript_5534/m.34250 type:complete len:103 (-) Transcript_5534:436-744(-)
MVVVVLVPNPTLRAIDSAVVKAVLHSQCKPHTQGNAKSVLERCEMDCWELELWDSQGCMMFVHLNTMLKVDITMWHDATAQHPLPKSQQAIMRMACVSVTPC